MSKASPRQAFAFRPLQTSLAMRAAIDRSQRQPTQIKLTDSPVPMQQEVSRINERVFNGKRRK